MKYSKHCDHCGNKVTAYTHSLNVPLVKALRQLVDFYDRNRVPCNLQKHLNLTKNQYNNFQKLQYFKLVHRDIDGYVPTRLGTGFIEGNAEILNPAGTLGKEILDVGHEAWTTHNKRRMTVNVKDIDEISWKRREEYAEEKTIGMF